MDQPKPPPSPFPSYYIPCTLGGLVLGMVAMGSHGFVLGGVIGYLLAANFSLQQRLARLEETLASAPLSPQAEPAGHARSDSIPKTGAVRDPEAASLAASLRNAVPATGTSYVGSARRNRPTPGEPSRRPPADFASGGVVDNRAGALEKLGSAVKKFFTTGNIILKIGLIILFFGVSFLLKYAAQRNLVPIEVRLTAVTLGGLALLGIGWRLRHRQLLYGLLLQGGGVGILYLTIFAAAKLYLLLPFGLAFALMLGIVALSGALAVLQNEKWLAISGSIGGFLAPVLLSTGSGSHVALFSYYLLLNLGVLGIAWFKAWRELNLLGFVLTFVIGALWGSDYYQPPYFASVEPFLLAGFLLYVVVSVLFALKQPVDLKGYIDPPLVFGLPITTFALQAALVKNFEHGLAVSAVGFGLFYMLSALVLWRRHATMRMLVEIFLSFGVVFGSLAIPLALDGYWITAAWAMEGAALIWVGVRQTRLRARVFGVLLQLGAGIGLLGTLDSTGSRLPIVNGLFLGCALLAVAALFSSYYLTISTERIRPRERVVIIPLLVWGVCWWFGGGIREIDLFAQPLHKVNILLLFIPASCLAMSYAARKLPWRLLAFPPFLLLPVMVLLSVRYFGDPAPSHLFAGWGGLAWTVALASQYLLLSTFEKVWPQGLIASGHHVGLWLILFLFSREGAWGMTQLLDGGAWPCIVWGVVPAAGVWLVKGPARRLAWPVERFPDIYQHSGIALVVLYLCGWSLAAALEPGNPAPLPFLPLANPLEVFQIVVLLVCWSWAWQNREWLGRLFAPRLPVVLYGPAGAISFLWLNTAVARTVHFYGHVPYAFDDLFHSVVFQASISILWSLSALALMAWSARKLSRQVWMLGASLLALVVIKLLMVDLSGAGTIGRIVSFLAVGLLMLLIGYVSPLPPKQEAAA